MAEFVVLRDFLRDGLFAEMGDIYARITPLPIAIRVLRGCSTSWRSDETICLGTMMGLNIAPLQDLEIKMRREEGIPDNEPVDDRRLSARRMQQFLSMIKVFPRDAIFNSLPRLAIEGFRWAPASLLGTPRSGFIRKVEGDHGILDQKGRGLRVYAHGLLVTTDGRVSGDSSAPMLVDIPRPGGQIVTLKVEVVQPEGAYPPQCVWRPDTQYGIMLDESVLTVAQNSITRDKQRHRPKNGAQLELWFQSLYDRSNGNGAVVDAVIGYVRDASDTGIQVEHACVATVSLFDAFAEFIYGVPDEDLAAFDSLYKDGYDSDESDSADSEYLKLRNKGSRSDFAINAFGSNPDNNANPDDIPDLPIASGHRHAPSSSDAEVDEMSDWGSILGDADSSEIENASEKVDDGEAIQTMGRYIKHGRWFIV
ncbi:hypothetical protein M426DRAFT_23956 [Hypoxylon sp. CI-4A]|nr:hypothetical protein M426DRAFT_23956 [Hypoxylon sp. CI-4A]